MNKGELWIVNLPSKEGREQIGYRPALILANTKTDLIITIPLTSNIQALRFINTFEIPSSKENGLEKNSIALLFQISAIDKRRIIKKIGKLEENYIKEIDKKLKKMLEL